MTLNPMFGTAQNQEVNCTPCLPHDQNLKVITGKKQVGKQHLTAGESIAPWIHGSEPISPFRKSKKSVPTSPVTSFDNSPFNYSPLASQPSRKSITSNPLRLCEEIPHIRSKKQFDEPSPTKLWVPRNHLTLTDAIESSRDHIVDSLRLQLRQQGRNGFLDLDRYLRVMDTHNSGTLGFAEFYKAIKECQLHLGFTKKAVEHLFRFFDSDDSGLINCDEFLIGIRGVLKTKRKDLVLLVFDTLNADKSGIVNVASIKKNYAEMKKGSKIEDEALTDFLVYFEGRGSRGMKNGYITLNDFENYYSNLSASVDDDDYFELIIRNTWRLKQKM
jgi:Ca2+-binding EF-hand superfamily protein